MPIYAIEYSPSNNDYLIQSWDRMLETNHNSVMRREFNDYKLLSVALSPGECVRVMKTHSELLSRKEQIIEFVN